jgi:hypothetical protein
LQRDGFDQTDPLKKSKTTGDGHETTGHMSPMSRLSKNEEMTMRTTLLATAALAFMAASSMSVPAAQAAPFGLTLPTAQNQSLAEPVDYRTYCGRWRDICRDRWSWGTWRFRRCMALHNC